MILLGFTRAAGGGFISQQIDRATGGLGYCHAFVQFWDLDRVFEAHYRTGVRFVDRDTDAREVLFALSHLSPMQEREVLLKALDLAGAPYDMGACAHFVAPVIRHSPGAYNCSELAATLLKSAGLLVGYEPSLLSPNGLFQACQADGLVPPA